MNRPRMPRWFVPIWEWAGRTDDLLGRLRVLRNGALVAFAVFVILGITLLNALGPWGALAIVVAVICAGFALADELVARGSGISRYRAGSDDQFTDEARALWQEMRAFYIEQHEGLPPLDLRPGRS